MGFWNYYFIVKLALYFGNYIGFHRWENLGFAAVLLWPVESSAWRLLRQLAAVPAGIGLLYYDSWLPSLYRLLSQADNLSHFSFGYLLELLGRFVNAWVSAALLALCLLMALLGRKLRISTLTLIGLAFAPQILAFFQAPAVQVAASPEACPTVAQAGEQAVVEEPTDDASLNAALERFYADEAKRQVAFPKRSAGGDMPFDIIFLHICSLSWDDLAYVGDKSPLLSRFHILFSNFNSASTYSGPAVIRLLRGSCGQSKHKDLYGATRPQCYLFNQLADAGFTPKLLMNHDGHFGDFLQDVQQRGGLNAAPLPNREAAVHMYGFDDSPIYEDYSLLNNWWQRHAANGEGPVALFYNTISLHDGNRIPGVKSQDSLDTYAPRLKKLSADIDRFLNDLENSGRKAVVVLVAEHGAALRSEPMQISGMREIPSPGITLVPAAVRLVGLPAERQVGPLTLDMPSSYLGLSTLLANMVERNPFLATGGDLKSYLESIAKTDFVAENEDTVILRRGAKYFMHTPDGVWMEYESRQRRE